MKPFYRFDNDDNGIEQWDITKGDYQSNVKNYADRQNKNFRKRRIIYLVIFILILSAASLGLSILLI